MGAEFWAAIMGAVVGGAIALLVQLIALRAAANQRKEEKRDQQLSLGRAVLFKTLTIHSNLELARQYVQEEHEVAEALGAGKQPWQVLRPIPNLPPEVFFTTEEMSLILSLRDDDLFNALATLDQIHNSTIAIFRTYAVERSALTSVLPTRMIGTVGVTEDLTPEQMAIVGPKIVAANSIADTIVQRAAQDANESGQILDRVVQLLNSKLQIGLSLTPKNEPAISA